MKSLSKLILLTFINSTFLCLPVNYNLFVGPLLRPFMKPVLRKVNIDIENDSVLNDEKNPFLVNHENIQDNFETLVLNDSTKENLKSITQFIKSPEKFYNIGAKPPRGILIYGPPGTGKTTLGRALAKEAKCNFLYMAGSEADGKYVGTGASKIKELFDLGRKNAPTIIFIDEIDTIAKKRTDSEERYHSQTIQQLLVEMDGFKKSEKPVIVIGTTNNLSHLDEAILRSGRFDIHLQINLPDLEQKKKILRKNLKKVKISPSVTEKNIDDLCTSMDYFSGADIENAVNKACLNALNNEKQLVELQDLNKAVKDIRDQK